MLITVYQKKSHSEYIILDVNNKGDDHMNEKREEFINLYVNEVIALLNISNPQDIEKVRRLANERFIDTELEIYNTDKYTRTYISPIDFWYKKGDYILNENGVLNDTTKRHEAVTAQLISQYIDFRQMFKRMAKKAGAVGDTINESIYKTFELLTKLRINGLTYRAPHYGDIVMKTL